MKYLIILTLALYSFSCKTSKKQDSASNQDFIGEWMYSYEDNKDDIKAFRPATYNFPPSRGRTGMKILKDGTCTKTGIAPADGFLTYTGKWTFNKKQNTITFNWEDKDKTSELEKLPVRTETFTLVSASKEMLQLKPTK
jgi:hypothetical protein